MQFVFGIGSAYVGYMLYNEYYITKNDDRPMSGTQVTRLKGNKGTLSKNGFTTLGGRHPNSMIGKYGIKTSNGVGNNAQKKKKSPVLSDIRQGKQRKNMNVKAMFSSSQREQQFKVKNALIKSKLLQTTSS